MSAKLERLIARWFHPSGTGGTLRVLPSMDHDRHEQSLDRTRAVNRLTLRDINTHEMSKNGSALAPNLQLFDSGLPVTLLVNTPVHSTLHVGISLLGLINAACPTRRKESTQRASHVPPGPADARLEARSRPTATPALLSGTVILLFRQ
jgi:hypothetical protein